MAVYGAGKGVISGIGYNAAECLDALVNGRHGIARMLYFDSVHRDKLPVAEVKLSNEDLSERSGFSADIIRTALLSYLAAKEALDDALLPT